MNLLLAIGFVAGMVLLLVTNVSLQLRNTRLTSLVAFYRNYYTASNSLHSGAHLPALWGRGPGGPWKVELTDAAEKGAILLFEPNCKPCEQNWKSWDKLLEDYTNSNRLTLVSTSESLPAGYLKAHGLAGRHVLVGLDKTLQGFDRLSATPQTIVENKGIVEKSWVGVLSKSDLKEIESTLKPSKQ